MSPESSPEPDTRPVSALPNMGLRMEALCSAAGLHTVGEVAALGADAAYARLLAAGARPHFMAFLALAMGLQGRPIRDCAGPEKEAMRRRFEALLAAGPTTHGDDEALPADLARHLDALGLGPPRTRSPPRSSG